jgi:hypothetical protein
MRAAGAADIHVQEDQHQRTTSRFVVRDMKARIKGVDYQGRGASGQSARLAKNVTEYGSDVRICINRGVADSGSIVHSMPGVVAIISIPVEAKKEKPC